MRRTYRLPKPQKPFIAKMPRESRDEDRPPCPVCGGRQVVYHAVVDGMEPRAEPCPRCAQW